MLEVIALDARDALAAVAGGADRLELVGTMDQDGLSATVEQVEQIRAVSDIPIRAMLRDRDGFTPRIRNSCVAAHASLLLPECRRLLWDGCAMGTSIPKL